MATYQYTAGTPGGLLPAQSLAAGGTKNAAALVDLSTAVGGAVNCKLATGGTAPTRRPADAPARRRLPLVSVAPPAAPRPLISPIL